MLDIVVHDRSCVQGCRVTPLRDAAVSGAVQRNVRILPQGRSLSLYSRVIAITLCFTSLALFHVLNSPF